LQSKKIEIDEDLANEDEDEEARLARVLKDIANDVSKDIVMVEDYQQRTTMERWMCLGE
jgi:hypothetical protein